MNSSQYPALVQFLGGYLHQDFTLEHGSAEGAVTDFMTMEPDKSVRSSLEELEHFLASGPSNIEAINLLKDIGCAYYPRGDGWTELDWLKHVRKRLEQHAGVRHVRQEE